MALSPETIAEELKNIPRFEVTGTITSSQLVKKDNECLHTYESTLQAEQEPITFLYTVLVDVCTTDSVFEIEERPFTKNTQVTLSLTEDEPHKLVSSDVHNVPSFTASPIFSATMVAVLLLAVSGVILVVTKKNRLRRM